MIIALRRCERQSGQHGCRTRSGHRAGRGILTPERRQNARILRPTPARDDAARRPRAPVVVHDPVPRVVARPTAFPLCPGLSRRRSRVGVPSLPKQPVRSAIDNKALVDARKESLAPASLLAHGDKKPCKSAVSRQSRKPLRVQALSRVQIPAPPLEPCRLGVNPFAETETNGLGNRSGPSPPESTKVRESPLPAALTGERLAHGQGLRARRSLPVEAQNTRYPARSPPRLRCREAARRFHRDMQRRARAGTAGPGRERSPVVR